MKIEINGPGEWIHKFLKSIWSYNRSITGEGVRSTLLAIQKHCPELRIFEIPSGTAVFDWTIPKEWHVSDAYIITPSGEKICDFKKNNLHLVGYSKSIDVELDLNELQNFLYSLPDQPEAIPYITSYYYERWGFCISDEERKALKDGKYRVFIDAQKFDGVLNYGEIYIPGKRSEEVFLSTYICHPSMANNELSGIGLTTYLANYIQGMDRNYSYRIAFVPETIGAIAYLSSHLSVIKKNVIAGFNITCVGDEGLFSYLPSRQGNTLSDRAIKHALKWDCPSYKAYKWNDRGSDERQYCAPGVDLPIATLMKTKYGEYPEYHTSLDDLERVVTPSGLNESVDIYKKILNAIDRNCIPKINVLCEPQLGKRGLYSNISTKQNVSDSVSILNFITWADGENDLIALADKMEVPVWEIYEILDSLDKSGLLEFL